MTDEEKALELKNRQDQFNTEMTPLLTKYEFAIGATARITEDGRISASPLLIDTRKIAEMEKAVDALESAEAGKDKLAEA